MSDPVISFQNSGFSAQTPATATIASIPEAPPEITSLPTGMIIPAVITPPEDSASLPVIRLILPDGKQTDVVAKLSRIPPVPTPVSLKIMPFSPKKGMTVQVHFSAPLPDVNKAIREMPEALQPDNISPAASRRQSIPVRAFVLHSVPEQISALMNELESFDGQTPPPLKPDQSVRLEISPLPEQTSAPLPERNASPVSQTAGQNATPAIRTESDALSPATVSEPPPSEGSSSVVPQVPVEENAPAALPQTEASPRTPPSPQPSVPPVENGLNAPAPAVPEKAISERPATVRTADVPQASPSLPMEQTPQQTPLPVTEKDGFVGEARTPRQTTPDPLFRPAESPSGTASGTAGDNIPVRIPLKGVVFDFKERAAPLVVTKIGVLALEEKIQLPHMTPVRVEITDISEAPSSASPERETDAAFRSVGETLTLLRETDPEAFESFKSVLPQTGNKLPALIHSFVRAASQNSFAAFIGENNIAAIQNLGEKGRTLLQEIEKEFSSSVKKASDGRSSWKGWTVPFLSGAVVEPVSLYLQRPDEDGYRKSGEKAKPDAIRFVLDLNLTRLGKLQMDGLAHRAERRFDLIVRHQKDLPPSFDGEIASIFTQTLSALNYVGTVKVDHTDRFIDLTEQVEDKPKRGVWA